MKRLHKNPTSSLQHGAATLLTAIVLLICITLVALIASKTVLVETQISANNYRTTQASAAANAAMDYAIDYFNGPGGLDHDYDDINDGAIDGSGNLIDTNSGYVMNHTYTSGTQTTSATVFIDNSSGSICVPATKAPSMKWGLITAIGRSDDGLGTRTITQCVGTMNILQGEGPQQALISGASVGLTGSAQIINRYTDLNIWSGQAVDINSGAMETYIRPPDTDISELTRDQLRDTTVSPSIPNVQKVSNKNLGTGTDIYMNDTRLNISESPFYDLFFLQSKERMQAMAGSQYFGSDADSSDLSGLDGIIYVDGDASFGGSNAIGSSTSPAIVIIDGNFDISGGTIHGLVYVTGEISAAGNATIVGTLIAHGGVDLGAGTLTVVYQPMGGDNMNHPIKGTTGVISGSWRDW